MTILLVHTISGSHGGSVVGIASSLNIAKSMFAEATGRKMRDLEGCTDWGHFIRKAELDELFLSPLTLPRCGE